MTQSPALWAVVAPGSATVASFRRRTWAGRSVKLRSAPARTTKRARVSWQTLAVLCLTRPSGLLGIVATVGALMGVAGADGAFSGGSQTAAARTLLSDTLKHGAGRSRLVAALGSGAARLRLNVQNLARHRRSPSAVRAQPRDFCWSRRPAALATHGDHRPKAGRLAVVARGEATSNVRRWHRHTRAGIGHADRRWRAATNGDCCLFSPRVDSRTCRAWRSRRRFCSRSAGAILLTQLTEAYDLISPVLFPNASNLPLVDPTDRTGRQPVQLGNRTSPRKTRDALSVGRGCNLHAVQHCRKHVGVRPERRLDGQPTCLRSVHEDCPRK